MATSRREERGYGVGKLWAGGNLKIVLACFVTDL